MYRKLKNQNAKMTVSVIFICFLLYAVGLSMMSTPVSANWKDDATATAQAITPTPVPPTSTPVPPTQTPGGPTPTTAPPTPTPSGPTPTPNPNALEPGDYTGQGSLSGTRVLKPGVYVFDGISLAGGESITLDPTVDSSHTVTIFLKGNVQISGNGALNTGGTPTELFIYGTPSCTSITINGTGHEGGVHAAIYAPDAAITGHGGGSEPSDSCGSLIGKTLRFTGKFMFHYDEALGELPGTSMYMGLDKDNIRWVLSWVLGF